jgi:hypothetical protein
MRWDFDFGDMASFRGICSPLYRYSVFTDAGGDALQKFKLGNKPIVDDVTALPCNVPTGRLSDLDARGCFNESTTTRCVTLLWNQGIPAGVTDAHASNDDKRV